MMMKIHLSKMEYGKEVANELREGKKGGIPWFVILDGDGEAVANSDGPNGNIGCPITKDECAHFVKIMERVIVNAPKTRIQEIGDALEKFAAPQRRQP